MKPAAIYARVSTQDQADDGTSLTTQLEACRAYALTHGYGVVHEATDNITGSTLVRPGLDSIRNMADARQIEAILFYKLDRLSRDTADTLTLLKEFRSRGVAVESVTVKIEDTPEGTFLFTMLAAVASFEKSQIAERMRRGKERRAREGRVLGLNKRAFGYRYIVGEGRLEIIEEEAVWVRQIYSWLLNDGLTLHKICTRLHAAGVLTVTGKQQWGVTSVHRILHNDLYTGTWHYFKRGYSTVSPPLGAKDESVRRRIVNRPPEEWVAIPVPAIITQAEHDEAAIVLARNQDRSPRNSKAQYLLRSITRCLHCGHTLVGHTLITEKVTFHNYYCTGSKRGPGMPVESLCPNKYIFGPMLDEAVWGEVVKQLSSPETIEQSLREAAAAQLSDDIRRGREQSQIEAKEKRLAQEANTLLDLHLAGDIDRTMFSARMKNVKGRQAEVVQSRQKLESHVSTAAVQLAHILYVTKDLVAMGALHEASFETKRAFLEKFDLKIRADKESLEIDGLLKPVRVKMEWVRERKGWPAPNVKGYLRVTER